MPDPNWLGEMRATVEAERAAERQAELAAEKHRQARRAAPFPQAVGSHEDLVTAGLAHDLTPLAGKLAERGYGVIGFSTPVVMSTAAAAKIDNPATARRVLEWALGACNRRGFPNGRVGSFTADVWERYPTESLNYRGLPEGLWFTAFPTIRGGIFWAVVTATEPPLAWRPEQEARPLRDRYMAE